MAMWYSLMFVKMPHDNASCRFLSWISTIVALVEGIIDNLTVLGKWYCLHHWSYSRMRLDALSMNQAMSLSLSPHRPESVSLNYIIISEKNKLFLMVKTWSCGIIICVLKSQEGIITWQFPGHYHTIMPPSDSSIKWTQ